MNSATKRTVIGLVDAGGSGGGSSGGTDWSLIFHFAAWRNPNTPPVIAERRCEFPVAESDLRSLMERVKPYQIVEIEVADDEISNVTKVRRILRIGVSDAELQNISTEIQKEIVLSDSVFGPLVFDRRFREYSGTVAWCDNDVDVRLSCDNPDDPSAVLNVAKQLFEAQSDWNVRAREFAVEWLLPLKNESWLDEDESEVTPQDFAARIILQTIEIDAAGDFMFWYDDGDLFWRHVIQISGNLSAGLKKAGIAG